MSEHTNTPEMTQEDQLKAILYQFITLYERWAEDRQAAAKQGADTAQLVAVFLEQVKNFQSLEPKVRQQIINSIESASKSTLKSIGTEIGKEATRAVEDTARQLSISTEAAQRTLTAYQHEVVMAQWKVILTTAITTIATCLLLVWLLIPKATLPLTDDQVKDLRGGQLMSLVWPKLSKKEQDHWLALAKQIEHPEQNNNYSKNSINEQSENNYELGSQ